jgi:rhodanese-related sulfurtransferase
VICHHGMRSMQVARFLAANGFDRLINLSGGVDAWSRLVDQRVPSY